MPIDSPPDADVEALAIRDILRGHTQSLHQALRLLHEHDPSATAQGIKGDITLPILNQLIVETPVTDEKLLLTGLLKQHPKRRLVEELRPALPFVDLLISQLWAQAKVHNQVKPQALQFSLLLTARLLQRPDIAIDGGHPLTQLAFALFRHFSIWEPGSGRSGKVFPQWLQAFNLTLPDLDISSSPTMQQAVDNFRQYRNRERERTHRFEERLKQSEAGSVDLEQVRSTVVDFVGRRLSGQLLPESISAFIQTQLLGDLQYLVIHEGVGCPTWKKWQRLLQVLSWAFSPDNTPAHRRKVMTLLPPQIEQLNESYWQSFTDPDKYQPFLQDLHEAFVAVLQSLPLELEAFPALVGARQEAGENRIEAGHLEDLDAHQEGDWYLFQDMENREVAGKLLLKSPQKDLLLFTNYAGKTLARYGFEEFGLALISKIVRPLKLDLLYPGCLRATWQHLNNRHLYNLKIHQRLQESNAREQAAQKAREEAQVLAAQQQKPVAAPLEVGQARELQQSIDSLQVGAWLAVSKEDGASQHIKLSVKLQEADKYIFTDRVGQRAAEFNRAKLMELMASRQLKILSRGENFDSSLEKVVRGLRKKQHE
jgi:hypothetical protein